MEVIYVAGPYRAKTKEQRDKNIIEASKLGVKVWEIGMVPIVPHNNCRKFEDYTDKVTDETYLNGGLALMHRCDAILVVENNWIKSEGTRIEILHAMRYHIPIFFNIEDLQRWGKTHDYTEEFSKLFYQKR